MVKIKNLHPGILVVRLANGQVLELQPNAGHVLPKEDITGSEKAMALIAENKLQMV